MIAIAPSQDFSAPWPSGRPDWSARFLKLLPLIRRIARRAFRSMPRDRRSHAVQEVIANCCVAYARLVERGREEQAYATPLALYAVAQYRDGRRVGSSANAQDVSSPYCQRRNAVVLEALFQRTDDGQWEELVVEDKHSTPADIAATRLDFHAWLRRLGRTKRAAAKLLAGGAGTSEAAVQLRLSSARISQLRRELKRDWARFQGELPEKAAA